MLIDERVAPQRQALRRDRGACRERLQVGVAGEHELDEHRGAGAGASHGGAGRVPRANDVGEAARSEVSIAASYLEAGRRRRCELQLRQSGFDPVVHRPLRPVGAAERPLAILVDQVMAAAAASALMSRQSDVGRDHLLLLQTPERHVAAAGRHFAAGAIADLFQDGGAVRAIAQTDECQKYELFQFSENRREIIGRMDFTHIVMYITKI